MDIRKTKPSSKVEKVLGFSPIIAQGGAESTITFNNTQYKLHVFSSVGSHTFRVIDSGTIEKVEVLVVAGGGGGGMDMGGGGGGGGVISSSYLIKSGENISLSVGAGGLGGPGGSERRSDNTGPNPGAHQFTISGTNGSNSTFGNLTAIGGGYGGSSYFDYTPNSGLGAVGGCGGGTSGYSNGTTKAGREGTAGQGFRGGQGGGQYYSGGGGGAAQPGVDSTATPNGGHGVLNNILGSNLYWGGGGGGSAYSVSPGGNGGLGGGGGGAVGSTTGGSGYNQGQPGGGGVTNAQTNTRGGNGGTNTGGGGGGGSHYNVSNSGGDGGSGIVIVRYPIEKVSDIYPIENLKLLLDAGNASSYPGSGTTWTDLSGNGNNFTILATAYNGSNVKYMDFGGSYGCAKKIDSDMIINGPVTFVVWTRILTTTTNWRTLFRGLSSSGDHQVIIENGAYRIGMYDNDRGSGFNTSGYLQSSIPGWNTGQWNMLVWRWNPGGTNFYSLSINNSPQTIVSGNTSINTRFKGGICSIGAHNDGVQSNPSAASQYWGDIAKIYGYNRVLNDTEVLQIFNNDRSRFGI
jgi:hypothetical protein